MFGSGLVPALASGIQLRMQRGKDLGERATARNSLHVVEKHVLLSPSGWDHSRL